MSGLNCIVVTPEATALDEKVDSVVVPLVDGELGIGTRHAPMIGRLGFGELRLTTGGQTKAYFVEDGFVQVQDNVVSVLTSRVRPLDAISQDEAQQLLEEALVGSLGKV